MPRTWTCLWCAFRPVDGPLRLCASCQAEHDARAPEPRGQRKNARLGKTATPVKVLGGRLSRH